MKVPSPPHDLEERVQKLEIRVDEMQKAFPLDDIGGPAIERHRLQHKAIDKAEKEVEAYKLEITKKGLTAFLATIAAIALAFFKDKIGLP